MREGRGVFAFRESLYARTGPELQSWLLQRGTLFECRHHESRGREVR